MQQQKLKRHEERFHVQESNLRRLESQLRANFPNDVNKIEEIVKWNIPSIYLITPTYQRPHQKAELTRLKNTFLHVPNLHWIIIEDGIDKSNLVTSFLHKSGLNYTHLNVATPENYKMDSEDPNWLKPRGVLQRNLGLEWIRSHVDPVQSKGVLYFADDDNTYDVSIFEEVSPMLFGCV